MVSVAIMYVDCFLWMRICAKCVCVRMRQMHMRAYASNAYASDAYARYWKSDSCILIVFCICVCVCACVCVCVHTLLLQLVRIIHRLHDSWVGQNLFIIYNHTPDFLCGWVLALRVNGVGQNHIIIHLITSTDECVRLSGVGQDHVCCV